MILVVLEVDNVVEVVEVVVVVEVEDDPTNVLRSAMVGGPEILLTAAGTVCKRICVGFVELVPMVCVTGPEEAFPTRNN